MDYFEATVHGLAVSRCPLTLRRKKLYTQRRRGQCHIRKSSWRLPISIHLPTCREAKSKTKQGGIAHHGRFPPYYITKNREAVSILNNRIIPLVLFNYVIKCRLFCLRVLKYIVVDSRCFL